MPLLDSTRRWIRDRTTDDELIQGKPIDKIESLSRVIVHLASEERQKNLEHLKAYIDYYYQGHHREQVPPETKQAFNNLSKEVSRLNVVDQAREILQQYGGPPTKETIQNSLERSAQQMQRKSVEQGAGVGIGY
jgi:hypothetical protein